MLIKNATMLFKRENTVHNHGGFSFYFIFKEILGC
jgi:hypothetical protein